MKIKVLLISLTCYLISCSPFIESPYSDEMLRPERNLNIKNLNKLTSMEADGLIKFSVFTDSHHNYRELDKVVYAHLGIDDLDFSVCLGDMTNTAYNFEYDEFLDAVKSLRVPGIFAMGNHDAVGAGVELYRKIFGAANFFFESPSFRFIVFNSNNWEDPSGFDPQWLRQTVVNSSKDVILFTHIPLNDSERYKEEVAQTFNDVMNHSRVKAVFNGHKHTYIFEERGGTVFTQAGRVQGSQGPHWLTVEVSGGQICVTRMDTGGSECKNLK